MPFRPYFSEFPFPIQLFLLTHLSFRIGSILSALLVGLGRVRLAHTHIHTHTHTLSLNASARFSQSSILRLHRDAFFFFCLTVCSRAFASVCFVLVAHLYSQLYIYFVTFLSEKVFFSLWLLSIGGCRCLCRRHELYLGLVLELLCNAFAYTRSHCPVSIDEGECFIFLSFHFFLSFSSSSCIFRLSGAAFHEIEILFFIISLFFSLVLIPFDSLFGCVYGCFQHHLCFSFSSPSSVTSFCQFFSYYVLLLLLLFGIIY